MDELEKLYNVLKRDGYYTKSYDDFQAKWKDETYRKKVYDVAKREGLYTKDSNSFMTKYSSLKKKGSTAPAQVPAQAPVQTQTTPVSPIASTGGELPSTPGVQLGQGLETSEYIPGMLPPLTSGQGQKTQRAQAFDAVIGESLKSDQKKYSHGYIDISGANKVGKFISPSRKSTIDSEIEYAKSSITELEKNRNEQLKLAIGNPKATAEANAFWDSKIKKHQDLISSNEDFIKEAKPSLTGDDPSKIGAEKRAQEKRAQAAFENDFKVLEENDPEYLAKVKKYENIEKITDVITSDFIGQSEEDVVASLRSAVSSVDSEYQLFSFEESGAGDNMVITNNYTGDKMPVSLDNWTSGRDMEEAEIAKAFISLNAKYPEYSVVSKKISDLLASDAQGNNGSNSEELTRLIKEQSKIRSEMRNSAKNYKYESYVFNRMNKPVTLNNDFEAIDQKTKDLEQKSGDYNKILDFYKEGDYKSLSEDQKVKALDEMEGIASQIDEGAKDIKARTFDVSQKSEANEEIAGLAYNVAEKRGNLGTGLMKSFTTGLSSGMALIANAADQRSGAEAYTAEDIAKDVFYDGVIDQEYMESSDRGMVEQALFGVTESVGAMLSYGPVGVAAPALQVLGVYSMSYLDMKEQMSGPEFDDVSEEDKIIFSGVYGMTIGLLDRIGISKSVSKTPVGKQAIGWLLNKTFSSLPKKSTYEAFERELKVNAKMAISKGLFDVAGGGTAEGGTEALQAIADIGFKKVFNAMAEKEAFDTPETWQEGWEQVSNDAILGFIGGGIMNGTSTVLRLGQDQWTKNSIKSIEKLISNPELLDVYTKHIKTRVLTGEMTQAEAEAEVVALQESEALFETIPENITGEDRYKAFSLIAEKRRIEQEIEGKEKALVTSKSERVSEINQELKDVSNKPVSEDNSKAELIKTLKEDLKFEQESEFGGNEEIISNLEAQISETEKSINEDTVASEAVQETEAPISELENVTVIEEEGMDVEYKVDDGFFIGTEEEFVQQLQDPEFIDKVKSGEVKLDIQNPSPAVMEAMTPKVEATVAEYFTVSELEKEMSSLEDMKDDASSERYNEIEKELESREWSSVMSSLPSEVDGVIDALIKKEKEMPDGYGTYLEARDARETKEVAEKYKSPENIKDSELKKDFVEALVGNPTTWYADGFKLKSSINELINRGYTLDQLLSEAESRYTKAGYDTETAKDVVSSMIDKVSKRGNTKSNEEFTPSNRNAIEITTTKTESKESPKVLKESKQIENELADLETKLAETETSTSDTDFIPEVIIAQNLPKITSKSAKAETGGRTGANKDIAIGLINDTDGKTVNEAAHEIWQDHFQEDGIYDTEYVRDKIIDILLKGKPDFLNEYTKAKETADIKREIRSVKKNLADAKKSEKAAEKFYGSDSVTDAEMSEMTPEAINQSDNDFVDYINSLTDEQIEEEYGKYEYKGEAAKPTTEGKSETVGNKKEAGKETKGKPKPDISKVTKEKFDYVAKAIESAADKIAADLGGIKSSPLPIIQAAVAGSLRVAAKSVRLTGNVTQAIQDGINHLKSTSWYKGLSEEGQTKAETIVRSNLIEAITDAGKTEAKTEAKAKPAESKAKIEPKAKSEQKSEVKTPKEKERLFAKQVLESEVSEDIKDGLSKNARTYIPISNKVTVSEANFIIQEKGVEQAAKDVLDFDNKMVPRVRIVMGQQLIKVYNEQNTVESLEYAVDIANELSQYATELGQGIQVFALWDKISSDGLILGYEKSQKKARKKIKDQNSNFYEGNKKGYKAGTKKAAKKASQKVFGKDTPKINKVKAFNMTKSELSKKKKEALDKFKNSLKGGPLTSGGINVDALNALTDYGYYVFADGVRTFKEWAAEMKKATGVQDNDVLRSVWLNQNTDQGKTLDELSKIASIEDVVTDHFSKSTDIVELAEKLKDTFGLDNELAEGLASELTAEFEAIVKNERKNEIKKRTTGRISPKAREAIDSVSETDNMNDSDIEKQIEQAFGVTELTEDQKVKIKDLTTERDSRPEGFLKDEMTREVLSEFEKAGGISKGDIMWSMWYASVLSGYETQMLNIGANSLNIVMESMVTLIEKSLKGDPKAFAKGMQGLFEGMVKGHSEFNQVLSKGYSPEKIKSKLETKDVLDNVNFKGGKLNPFNYYKYVGRFMSAVDTGAYMAADGMRKQEAAREIGKSEGLKGKDLASRVTELLNNDSEAYNAAKSQAEVEVSEMDSRGVKMSSRERKRLVKIRANEIISESIPEEITEKAKDFASFVTYNYDPEGVLGMFASGLAGWGQKFAPFKLIVPFTRIVANVLNQQLDYFPVVGYARAFGVSPSSIFNMYSQSKAKDVSDRNRKLIKATMGLMMMTGLYALAKMYDEDDEPFFEMSGKGPSDSNKISQLYSQGWKPYSIKIGKRWYGYQYTPAGAALSYVGNWLDNEKYEGLSEADMMTRSAFAIQYSAAGITDMSFLSGLSGFMGALSSASDPKKLADDLYKSTGRTMTSFVPNFFKQIDKAYDPTIYDTKTIEASIMSEIPILKRQSGLKPRINAFGQEVEKKGNRFSNKVTDDKAWLFMAKHNVFAPGAGSNTKNIEGVLMTDDEFYDYMKLAGGIVYEQINEEMESLEDDFSEMTQEEKQDYISAMYVNAKKEAKYLISE